jgi:hypothetical protein
MAAMVRIGYCFGMAEALDPARLSSLPEDLRVAFKALVEKSFELDIERTARLQQPAIGSVRTLVFLHMSSKARAYVFVLIKKAFSHTVFGGNGWAGG